MPEEEISEATRSFWFFISILLIVLGIAYYWAWSLMYGTWNLLSKEGLGAYIITIMLLGFGILGALLTRKKR